MILALGQRNYVLRFISIVTVCIFANLFGIGLSQISSQNIFYLDMVGTAIASLSSGLVAGLIVAVLTGLLGFNIVNENYALFTIVNCYGALVWAIIPRFGKQWLGSEIFKPQPEGGYRRIFLGVVTLGSFAGFVTAFAAFAVQCYILPSSTNTLGVVTLASGGSQVAKNNLILTSAIVNAFSGASLDNGRQLAILFESLVSNVPDKIMATATAVVAIFAVGTLPNYSGQREFILRGVNEEIVVVGRRTHAFLILLLLTLSVIFFFGPPLFEGGALVAFGITYFIPLLVIFTESSACRSVDRRAKLSGHASSDDGVLVEGDQAADHRAGHTDEKLFYRHAKSREMKFQKDAFEDVLKILVVLLTILSGYAYLAASEFSVIVDGEETIVNANKIISLGVANIFILTSFRYLIVFATRFAGRM